jgi:hypothetical protein
MVGTAHRKPEKWQPGTVYKIFFAHSEKLSVRYWRVILNAAKNIKN